MRKISFSDYTIAADCQFDRIPEGKVTINTINAYSWVLADQDPGLKESLRGCDYLLPDGISIVWAVRFLRRERIRKMAGSDLHVMLLETLERNGGSCFYLGASEKALALIRDRVSREYPHVRVGSYCPPYMREFSRAESGRMIGRINDFAPDALFIGMTAPKQEKWLWENQAAINARFLCCIGAVFDFYSGMKKRPAPWMIRLGLEWFGRLLSEPARLWKRYLLYNPVFIWKVFRLKKFMPTFFQKGRILF